MSHTEIYGFDKDGKAYMVGEVHNAFRGAYSIWTLLGKKYLGGPSMFDQTQMQAIWDLMNDPNVKMSHRVVMASTMDKVVVKMENLPKLFEAYEEFCKDFPGNTNLPEQLEEMKKLRASDMGLAWNQTSVCQEFWRGWDEEKDEEVLYNLNDGDIHWFLFDGLTKGDKK